MRGKVGGLSPPYFKSRGAIAPLAPLLPPPLLITIGVVTRPGARICPGGPKHLPGLPRLYPDFLHVQDYVPLRNR